MTELDTCEPNHISWRFRYERLLDAAKSVADEAMRSDHTDEILESRIDELRIIVYKA